MAMEQPEQSGQARESISTCYWHPEVETGLSCSRCGKNICTNCLVQVPVGIRCRECGRAQPMPAYDVRPPHYLQAIGTAILLAVFGGIAWVFVDGLLLGLGAYGSVSAMLAIPFGYGAGEIIGKVLQRKRNILISYVAALTVIIAFLLSRIIHLIFVELSPGFGSLDILFLVMGAVIAWQRLRR